MKNVLTQIARAIEAKVIEKIKAQGPDGFCTHDENGMYGTPLYRLPEGD